MLSNRQMNMLHLLIEEDEYKTIVELAERFDVSQRTIQYDLEGIEDHANRFNYRVYRNKSAGVKIEALDNYLLADASHKLRVHYTKEERVLNITLKLFESEVPISSNTLAEMVNVSRRTIVDDLKVVQEWLNAYHLELNYIKNKGFNIQGHEEDYRKAYAHQIRAYFRNAVPYARSGVFSEDELMRVRQTVVDTLKHEDYHLVQSATDGLIYHVLIALQRLKENFSFDIPEDEVKRLSQTPQYEIASKMKENLEREFEIEFPKSEAIFITLHLLGSKVSDDDNPGNNSELQAWVTELIKQVSIVLCIDLTNDHKLLNNLMIHMKPAIHRLKFDMAQKNPLKDEIYQRYSNIVEAIESYINILEEPLHITFSQDELAFIAIHFASSIERVSTHDNNKIKVVLLCGSGIGTSQLLKSKLANTYPELDIADAYSVYQINEQQLLNEKVDYIISTVSFNIDSIPVIHVDPFLNKSSRDKLNQMINQAREQRIAMMNEMGDDLRALLPKHRISINNETLNKSQAIDVSVQSLVEDNIVKSAYAEEIKMQFERFGSYMVISPHIALIHASTEQVIQGAGFALTYFEYGITFGHVNNDPVHVVITLATKSPKIHLKALGQLSELLMNKDSQAAFLEGNVSKINEYINQVSKKGE
ncbi:BglG family transcription antiterminator [Staphylococcus simulans]|uniref:BglG family transcription antiterminator n=1 Tax=Staphylococcus simulans TaxID=1286 RepID=UPI00399B2FB6